MSTNNNPAEIFSRPNQEARIHDFEHLVLWADTPNRPGFRARMVFGERNGAFRISIFPNLEEGPKVISCGMGPTVFKQFVVKFRSIIHGPADKRDKVANLGRDPSSNSEDRSGPIQKVVNNVVHFGKDKDGIVWIGIKQGNVENIMFRILSNAWHHFFHEDGTQVTPEEGSVAEASALLSCLEDCMAKFGARLRPPYDKSKAGGKTAGAGGSDRFAALNDEDVLF